MLPPQEVGWVGGVVNVKWVTSKAGTNTKAKGGVVLSQYADFVAQAKVNDLFEAVFATKAEVLCIVCGVVELKGGADAVVSSLPRHCTQAQRKSSGQGVGVQVEAGGAVKAYGNFVSIDAAVVSEVLEHHGKLQIFIICGVEEAHVYRTSMVGKTSDVFVDVFEGNTQAE